MSQVLPIAYLEAQIGGQLRQIVLAPDRILRIGRSDKNDLALEDDLVSRSHAMLQRSSDGVLYVTDLGSSNGTFVNGGRISTPAILRAGDRLSIGHHEFIFRQESVRENSVPEPSEGSVPTRFMLAQSLITVLVADIRDFTGLSQRIDAETLSTLTRAFFREAGRALQTQGAWAQKYIGDAVMAVWIHKANGPELSELTAVLEGLAQLNRTAMGLQAQFDLAGPVRFGAGINTGWASVGNVGSVVSPDYTASGETVNKAFRLESSTKEISRDLVIGQDTYDFLVRAAPKVKAQFTPVTVRMKGYDEPATAFALDLDSLAGLLASL